MQLTTVPNPYAPGFPRAPDESGAPKPAAIADATALAQALRLAWPTDRHFQAIAPFTVNGAPRRVNVAQLTDEQLSVAPVRMVARVFDVDTPNHEKRTDAWTLELVEAIAALPHAKPLYYFTNAGARLLWALSEPFVIDSRAAYARWVREQEANIRMLREKYGIPADAACKDPSRLYRLPNVERAEKGTQRSEVFGGDPANPPVWDYPYFKKYEQETPAEALTRAAVVASASTPAAETKLARGFGDQVRVLGPEKVAVRCPWCETHSDHGRRDPLAGGTVVFATSDGEGFFWCSHAHCAARRQSEVYEALGLAEQTPWCAKLERTDKGAVKQTAENVLVCLEGTGGPPGWAWNARAERWENPRGQAPTAPRGMVAETMAGELTVWVCQQLGFDPTQRIIKENVLPWLARTRSYNPLTDWLDACAAAWDGVSRNLADYCACADAEWARLAFATWLRSAVARAYEPGCQADMVLVLQGPQGIRKSTLLNLLAKRGAYALELSHVDDDRDTLARLHRGPWLIELAEGVAISRADAKLLKAFITRRTDVYRKAYAMGEEERPRSCVFAASTNETQFLNDPTGARRWAVVRLNAGQLIDTDGVSRDLEQLIGQAVAEYRQGVPWWLTAEQQATSDARAAEFAIPDQLYEHVLEWTNGLGGQQLETYSKRGAPMRELLSFFEKHIRSSNPATELGRALRMCGWENSRKIEGLRYWVLTRKS